MLVMGEALFWEIRENAARERYARVRAALPGVTDALARRGVRRIWVFGSFLIPGRFREDSDLDIAVEGLLPGSFLSSGVEAEAAAGISLDLVEIERCDSGLRKRILEEGRLLYER